MTLSVRLLYRNLSCCLSYLDDITTLWEVEVDVAVLTCQFDGLNDDACNIIYIHDLSACVLHVEIGVSRDVDKWLLLLLYRAHHFSCVGI